MSAEKTNSQAGFSLIEMTIVLAILAIGATTAMSVVNNRLEEAVTTRTVADLRVVAEAAYECYVVGNCKDAENGGWDSSITTATGGVSANTILGDYLPVGLSDRYKFEALSPNEDGTVTRSKVKVSVDMEDNARASRVARRFGSSASVSRSGQAVFVTLGVPGTEQAFIAAGDKIKNEIKSEDFVFGTPPVGGSKSNIAGAGDISADSITVGGATIGERTVRELENALGLACKRNEKLSIINGTFSCVADGTCLTNGKLRLEGFILNSRIVSCDATCPKVAACSRGAGYHCVYSIKEITGIGTIKVSKCMDDKTVITTSSAQCVKKCRYLSYKDRRYY